MEGRIYGKVLEEFCSLEWKRGVTDGDSGDDGNDELVCL